MEEAEQACHELFIRRVDTGDTEIPELLLVAVPGEEQVAVGRGAMEDKAVRIDQKAGGAKLREIIEFAKKPFILKGIMTPAGARKAMEAGAAGIVVSNHGGRVLDQCPATAEVLPGIADAVGGRIKIFVDGGIRTGLDVFKALALGADGVLIGRPFVTMVYGGGAEGVQVYVNKLQSELKDAMQMCGVHSLEEIGRDQIFRP